MWKIKQKIFPRISESKSLAKLNSNGQLVTNKNDLLRLYKDEYQSRLKHRKIEPKYENLMKLKETLFEWRLSLSKIHKTPEWSIQHLLKILRSLKVNKFREVRV